MPPRARDGWTLGGTATTIPAAGPDADWVASTGASGGELGNAGEAGSIGRDALGDRSMKVIAVSLIIHPCSSDCEPQGLGGSSVLD